jgi:YHS domain-containing protein
MSFRTVFSLVALAVACADAPKAQPQPEPTPAPAAPVAAPAKAEATQALTRIEDPSTVCMINDQHMGVQQIPVSVEGKTYYGCCQMCEAKLKTLPAARLGTDPVSGQQVDKASAVLAKDATGKVLYFESAANMQTYASRL